jgi:hypothetical protein
MASVQMVAEHQTLRDDPAARRARKISLMLLRLTQFRSQPRSAEGSGAHSEGSQTLR